MYKSQPKNKKPKVSTEPKKGVQLRVAPSTVSVDSNKLQEKNASKRPEIELQASVPKKAKSFVPGKFLTKHLVKSPFKFTISAIPDEISDPLFVKFFENLNSCVPKATNKRILSEGLVIGLSKILRMLQQHVASPTEFPIPLRLLLVCNKDLIASTLLYPLTQLISMLEKPGTFGALPLSADNAAKVASCLALPNVMVVGIKAGATSFDPFIKEYVESAESKCISIKPWPTAIRPVEFLPLETKQSSVPVVVFKSKILESSKKI